MPSDGLESDDHAVAGSSLGARVGGYGVHLLTASGVVCALLAAMEIASPAPDPRRVFLYLALQVLIDAVDGPLARRFKVKVTAPLIDGRTIDDIVDYLTYTFIPLLLVWRMGWVPDPALLFIAPAMVASLFGFANTGAKDEGGGFFLGFPSYWNIVAFYLGLTAHLFGAPAGLWFNGLLLLGLALLTVLPVRFVYPNLAPHPWRWPTLIGALLWTGLLVAMTPRYPNVPRWLIALSAVYPALYTLLSLWLDQKSRAIARHEARVRSG